MTHNIDIKSINRLDSLIAAFQKEYFQGYVNVEFKSGFVWGVMTYRKEMSGAPDGYFDFCCPAEAAFILRGQVPSSVWPAEEWQIPEPVCQHCGHWPRQHHAISQHLCSKGLCECQLSVKQVYDTLSINSSEAGTNTIKEAE